MAGGTRERPLPLGITLGELLAGRGPCATRPADAADAAPSAGHDRP